MAIVTGYVHIRHPETAEAVTLKPGDAVPEWAVDIVTNPAILADESPAREAQSNVETADDKPSREEVIERAKALGVSAKGKTETILARIAEAERAAEPEPTGRDALAARAKELGIEFTDETTDAELELLIQSKE